MHFICHIHRTTSAYFLSTHMPEREDWVLYIRTKLSSVEKKYTTVEWEALAIKWVCQGALLQPGRPALHPSERLHAFGVDVQGKWHQCLVNSMITPFFTGLIVSGLAQNESPPLPYRWPVQELNPVLRGSRLCSLNTLLKWLLPGHWKDSATSTRHMAAGQSSRITYGWQPVRTVAKTTHPLWEAERAWKQL